VKELTILYIWIVLGLSLLEATHASLLLEGGFSRTDDPFALALERFLFSCMDVLVYLVPAWGLFAIVYWLWPVRDNRSPSKPNEDSSN